MFTHVSKTIKIKLTIKLWFSTYFDTSVKAIMYLELWEILKKSIALYNNITK